MAKVSEVVAILKKQSDLIGKLRSEKADLLAALRALLDKLGGDMDMHLAAEKAQARAAIERAS